MCSKGLGLVGVGAPEQRHRCVLLDGKPGKADSTPDSTPDPTARMLGSTVLDGRTAGSTYSFEMLGTYRTELGQ